MKVTLEKHAPTKKRYARVNRAPYMNKNLSKKIMKRSRLRNKFFNTRSDLQRKAYNKQRNYVVSLLRKEKKQFYSNLNTNILTENRTFWKTAKPFLTDKTQKTSRITLIEEERVISQDHLIAKTFNEYFINIPIKNMPKNQEYENFDSSEGNPVERNFLKTNSKLLDLGKLTDEIKNVIEKLDPKQASQKSDMSTNILKKMQLFSPSTSAMISILQSVPRSSTMNCKRQISYRRIERSQHFLKKIIDL